MLITGADSQWKQMFSSQAISNFLSPQVAAIFLLGFFWQRTNEPGAFWGLMIGFAFGILRFGLEFGYFIPQAQFAPFLGKAVELIRPKAYDADGFKEENLEETENAMGALMKLTYKHIDGSNLTK